MFLYTTRLFIRHIKFWPSRSWAYLDMSLKQFTQPALGTAMRYLMGENLKVVSAKFSILS
jgi:hypothetical protein